MDASAGTSMTAQQPMLGPPDVERLGPDLALRAAKHTFHAMRLLQRTATLTSFGMVVFTIASPFVYFLPTPTSNLPPIAFEVIVECAVYFRWVTPALLLMQCGMAFGLGAFCFPGPDGRLLARLVLGMRVVSVGMLLYTLAFAVAAQLLVRGTVTEAFARNSSYYLFCATLPIAVILGAATFLLLLTNACAVLKLQAQLQVEGGLENRIHPRPSTKAVSWSEKTSPGALEGVNSPKASDDHPTPSPSFPRPVGLQAEAH